MFLVIFVAFLVCLDVFLWCLLCFLCSLSFGVPAGVSVLSRLVFRLASRRALLFSRFCRYSNGVMMVCFMNPLPPEGWSLSTKCYHSCVPSDDKHINVHAITHKHHTSNLRQCVVLGSHTHSHTITTMMPCISLLFSCMQSTRQSMF